MQALLSGELMKGLRGERVAHALLAVASVFFGSNILIARAAATSSRR